jgi:hypothetical protein
MSSLPIGYFLRISLPNPCLQLLPSPYHKKTYLVTGVNQRYPVYKQTPCTLKVIIILFSSLRPGITRSLYPLGLELKLLT